MYENVLTSVEQINAGIDAARQRAADKGKMLTIEAVAFCLGVSRNTLLQYVDGTLRPSEITDDGAWQDICQALSRIWLECNADLAEGLTDLGNVRGREFLAKNNYGYTDKHEQDIKMQLPVFTDDLCQNSGN